MRSEDRKTNEERKAIIEIIKQLTAERVHWVYIFVCRQAAENAGQ